MKLIHSIVGHLDRRNSTERDLSPEVHRNNTVAQPRMTTPQAKAATRNASILYVMRRLVEGIQKERASVVKHQGPQRQGVR